MMIFISYSFHTFPYMNNIEKDSMPQVVYCIEGLTLVLNVLCSNLVQKATTCDKSCASSTKCPMMELRGQTRRVPCTDGIEL